METNLQISQALLDKAITTTANLQAMIEETTTRYRDSPILGKFIGPYSAWTVCGILLSVIGAHSPRLTLAALAIGAGEYKPHRLAADHARITYFQFTSQ